MIRTKLAKPLALTIETIRALDTLDLEKVVGGKIVVSAGSCVCSFGCTKACPK